MIHSSDIICIRKVTASRLVSGAVTFLMESERLALKTTKRTEGFPGFLDPGGSFC